MNNYLRRTSLLSRFEVNGRWRGSGTSRYLAIISALFWMVASSGCYAQTSSSGPEYSSDETKEIVENMIEAHGGLNAWRTAPSFQFTSIMYLSALPVDDGRRYIDNWRNYRVTLNPRTNQGYVKIEYEDSAGPNIGFDGKEVWQIDYSFDPSFQDDAFMLLYFHYGMLVLPWMTQEPGVVLTYEGRASLPRSEVDFHRVRLTFRQNVAAEAGFIDIYIHPETFLVSGWNATSPYPLLPGGKFTDVLSGNNPTLVRIVEEHSSVDGVVIPRAYTTIRVADDGSETMMGTHIVVDPSLSRPLDKSLFKKRSGAKVIRSVD